MGSRTAVVTGGTAGVGRATVRALAGKGWDVAVLARGRAGLDGAVADVEAAGRRGLAVECDVADRAAVEAAAERVESELGPVGLWVNNAFVGSLAPFWDTDPDEYERMTAVTYLGQVNGTRAALRHMRPRDAGVVVNVGSALSHRAIPLQSAYCGAKHAVRGFSESVRVELKAEGSRVQLCQVMLPGLDTPQFDWNANQMDGHPMPVAPIFAPEVAARGIAHLADHPRRTLWVGVSTAYTIIGQRVAPSFLDWYLARTGISGQQTDDASRRRGSNVWEPRDEGTDVGAGGSFSDRSVRSDPWSAASMHRGVVGAALAGAGAAAGALAALRRR
ncbi:SDR family oxidoreductase [Pseudokineococcus lusitanus]|uniref:Short-subunit dehydrogenase n=1 Tax=Pseudokineococcus lusitanus TaxID=763993 RepID=A0A3N1HJX7_9ACTN|nr:SDR family oxidoreductase [Pseudokineococcus lusitanus]ROP42761.1 short-subunit dehydrogenase [Pseudokineococcus lusitanus]